MPLQYSNIKEDLFSKGIDARSAETRIPEGFVRDALNADVVETHARKRTGHVGFAGNLPVRVTSVSWDDSDNLVYFTLDQAISSTTIDLLNVRSSPIVVYGKVSSAATGTGPFNSSTNVCKWYSGFTQSTRQLFQTGTNTLTIAGTTHGLGTSNLFVEVAEANAADLGNTSVSYSNLNIDQATYDVTIDYTNSTGAAVPIFTYYRDVDAVTGTTHISSPLVVGAGLSNTLSISAATHQLSNYNIIARCYRDATGSLDLIRPESLIIDTVTGEVTVEIYNHTTAPATYYTILLAAPSANTKQGMPDGDTYTITIDQPTSPFIFPGLYVNSGTNLEEVIPDSVTYDSTLNQLLVTFTNTGGNAFTLFWEDGAIRSTVIAVSDTSVTADGSDSAPQLTIWGLDHTEIYGSGQSDREGWTTYIDSYRISGEQRVVAGLGGNLYTAQTYAEAGSAYKFGSLYPNLSARVGSATVMGPALWETGELPKRTRGYITGTGLTGGWGTVTAVSWDAARGSVKYTLTIPSLAMYTSAGATEATVTNIIGTDDELTVSGMGYSVHNGTFRIEHVERSGNTLSIWCFSDTVDSTDWDDSGVAGQAGIFTDQFPTAAAATFLPGDVITSDAISTALELEWLRTSAGGLAGTVSGVVELVPLQSGVQVVGQRTGSVMPLRTAADVSAVTNFVRGDMATYSESSLPLRVMYINALGNESVAITGDGSTATVTGISDTSGLAVGMSLILLYAGDYTGEIEIATIESSTSITFDSSITDSETGTILGYTVHLGEPVEWADSSADANSLDVTHRFIPVEAPLDSYALTKKTYTYHLDASSFGDQPFLRSVMIQDNLYMTNGEDEVMKFDGTNIYRAGLLSWQPGVFIQVDTAPSGKIVLEATPRSTPTAVNNWTFTLPLGDSGKFPQGTAIRYSDGTTGNIDTTSIRAWSDNTNDYVQLRRVSSAYTTLDGTTLGATPVLQQVATFRYYYRMDAVDANNNVIASAMSQSEDTVVQLSVDAAVHHKLIGMPNWGNYDFDRIYFRCYRTRSGTDFGHCLVHQQRVPFNRHDGYIEFTDTLDDFDLNDTDPLGSLKSGELGIGWDAPPRAACLTSAGNTLVLGNITGYPEMDMRLFGDSTVTATTLAGDTVLFRRDYTDIDSTSNTVDRIKYEYVNTSTWETPSASSSTVGVSFTLTMTPAPAVGDWIYVGYQDAATSTRPLTYCGWWQVKSVTDLGGPGPYEVTFLNANATATAPDVTSANYLGILRATTAGAVPVPIGTDYTFGQYNGNSNIMLYQAGRRLAMAINCTMRMADTTISGQSTFTPWLIAKGGSDTGVSGRVIVSQPRADSDSFSATWSGISGYSVFLNDIETTAATAQTRLFPSRVLVGYRNFPEIMDYPTTPNDYESDSAIDVNPSDGQEIVAVTPFFGESAFGAAQQSSVVVVLKERSIYLVDINEKRAGRNPVQRIETEGVGCTAPNSVAVTKDGILFANESGIYALRKNLSVEFVGKYMDRNWQRVDRSQLDLIQGHHYSIGRQYKASVLLLDGSNEVFVYDHTNEAQLGVGAWTRYDSHNATGWCNLGQDAYFSTNTGRVMVLRRRGDKYDYQDDHSAINCQLQTRSTDFGVAGIRKAVASITVGYRTATTGTATLGIAIDTEQEYDTDTPAVISDPATNLDGLGDPVGQDVQTVAYSLHKRRGTQFSVQASNNTRLEGMEITGMEFRVATIGTGQGIKQAADTSE